MKYNFVTKVKSHSSNREYEVKLRDDGMLTCNCPSWIFKTRGMRTCKHVEEVIRAGFKADHQGKFIDGVGNWGGKVMICCNNYPDKCDACNLRWVCYTEKRPEFNIQDLKNAGVVKGDI